MKKLIFSVAIIATVAIAGWNYQQNRQNVVLSDLALANIEALASGETSEEFFQATGCKAVQENKKCLGKDGKTHTFAIRP